MNRRAFALLWAPGVLALGGCGVIRRHERREERREDRREDRRDLVSQPEPAPAPGPRTA